MYELARVRLFSVGPSGARYQDVTLDFRGVGQAVSVAHQEDLFAPDAVDATPRRPSPASVLFLENGGGKSVLLKLVFSVLLPGRRQVVGTTSTTVLEKFVLAEDVAHVALEWMHTSTGRLLVTGKVSEWRGHVASTDPEKLSDAWYSFRPVPGFGLDDLPFTLERRRVTTAAFRDGLHEADGEQPECELTWETGQRDWTRHLVDTGLDPELFRYQRAMNAGEGEAAEAFSFPNDEAFVDFLLRAVLDPDEPQALADLVAGYATKLAQRAELETEREFVDGTLERLAPLGDAEERAAAARQREGTASRSAAALAAAIVARRAAEAEHVDATAALLADAETDAERTAGETRALAAAVTELRRLTAALEVADAERAEATAVAGQREAAAVVDAWAAVEPLRAHRLAAAEAVRLRRRVEDEQERARPALAARRDAALALAAALRATAVAADAAAEAADTERAQAAARAEAAHKVELEQVSEVAGADGTARQAAETLATIDARVDAAVAAGHLASVETDVDGAAEQARERAEVAARALADLHAQLDALRRDRRGADQRRASAQDAGAAARAAAGTARTALDDAIAVRAGLAAEDRAAELLGVDTVRPDSDAELVTERLRAAIGAGERERTVLLGDQARDQRALRALGEGGLLPDPPEIESVLGVLEAAGITAWSGRRYLAMLPDADRESVLVRVPHLAGGVLLNSAADAPRAREELAAARLLPACVVAVGSTAAMPDANERGIRADDAHERHIGDTAPAAPGVELVVPPNPAMYDETAAGVLRDELTGETEARAARMESLAERVESDRDLRSRFADWTARRPGVDELTEADERAATARDDAEKALAETAAEVAALDESDDRLTADRPHLEEVASTARSRADALEALRVEVARRPELRERQRHAEQTAARARAAAEAAAGEAQDAQRAAGVAQQTRDRQATTAVRARDEHGELPVGDEPLPEPNDDTPLDVLRDGYRRASDAYRTAEVDGDLQAALRVAEERESAARRPLDGVGAAVLEAADALLRSPDGNDAAARRAAAGWARATLEEADGRRQRSATALAMARKELAGFPDGGGETLSYGRPADVAHGRELVERAESDRRAADHTAAAATRTAQAAREAHRSASSSAEGFSNLVEGMDDPPDATGTEPFDGDVAAAVAATKSRQAAVKAAAGERAGAERTVRDAVDAVALFAQDPRFSSLASPVHRHIAGVARAEMPGLAPEWTRALRPRLRSLDDDLANIERHRSGIVVRLAGMVGEALRTLQLAQRLSALPEGLGDWSGQEFLRIRFERVEDSVLRHELGAVVDRTASAATGTRESRELRDGMSLLLRGVRAAMPKGVRVEMLKPDAVLRTERLRVSEIRDVFSGGQQLTAAIVLYCTMAALRAHQRGQGRRPHAGVLFLDNPIGRASAGYLLELQFGVARALGVQLVYTTGLFDAGALSAFPLVIRLRNDADLRAGRKYLSVDERVAAALGEPPEQDGTGAVTATRLYRRPDPATP